jgi:cell division protein ZapD
MRPVADSPEDLIPVSNQLIFEHPLNERIRTFLRLEHLFEKVEHFLPRAEHWSTRAAVEGLLDIVAITARADIKTELQKELDRNLSTLGRIRDQPGVDPGALSQVIGDLEQAAAAVRDLTGPIGAEAREDEFLKAVSQRNSIPGGACSFDLPLYHHLLTQPPETRVERLERWMADMRPIADAIRLVLSLARTSARPRDLVADAGFFQEALDPQTPAQLVRVGLAIEPPIFPEISGHKNRFSIRFMTAANGLRPSQSREPVPFALTCCVF